ncbi:MAG: T9SS type A sorting domain-containing protein, partial [Ignavibacteriaceae bacterium]|nr:T9SS type A sorting domain-containing protein [Ignavibacteriaceae bacterium]
MAHYLKLNLFAAGVFFLILLSLSSQAVAKNNLRELNSLSISCTGLNPASQLSAISSAINDSLDTDAPPAGSDSVNFRDFFPMHVGNRWQYIHYIESAPVFSAEISITSKTVANGKEYYNLTGFFNTSIRMQEDSAKILHFINNTEIPGINFQMPPDSIYPAYIFDIYTSSMVPISNEPLGTKVINGKSYRSFFIKRSGWPYQKQEFYEGIGLSQLYIYFGPPGVTYNNKLLTRAIIYNGDSIKYFSDAKKPTISFNPPQSSTGFNLNYTIGIGHPFHLGPAYSLPGFFIDSIMAEFYYSNGLVSTPVQSVKFPFNSTLHNTVFQHNLDTSLFKNGYFFNYRFTVKDMGVVPEYAYFPSATGWQRLVYDPYITGYWIDQSNFTTRDITDLVFINKNEGFALAASDDNSEKCFIYKTTNGGSNWNVTEVTGIKIPEKLLIYNQNTWFVGGSDGNSGIILKTTDRGISWRKVTQNGLTGIVKDILFTNYVNGYAVSGGSSGSLYRTTNGGESWSHLYSHNQSGFSRMFFQNDLNGTISTADSLILKTSDGGLSWQRYNVNFPINDFFMLDSLNCWIASDSGSAYKSYDGGKTWNRYRPHFSARMLAIEFSDPHNGIVTSMSGFAYRTADGGYSWITEFPNSGYPPTEISIAGAGNIWVAGKRGRIIKRFNPVATLKDHESSFVSPGDFTLLQNYPNPFNPSTVIQVVLPAAGKLKADVFDLLGREVSTLADDFFPEGQAELNFNGAGLPSGVYFCRVKYGG